MTRYVLPGLESMSEFVGLPTHEFGDCGEDAALMMMHVTATSPYPLSPYGLGSIDEWEQSHGYADPGGAQNIPSMDAALHALGVPHVTVSYADFTLDKLHLALQTGYSPTVMTAFIVETSTAGAGIPDDERNVFFHFYGIGGVDTVAITPDGKTGGYLRVDGDSRTDSQTGGLTSPILTSFEEIAASGPIAFITITVKVSPPVWTIEKDSAGDITGAKDDKGHTVGAGFASLIESENLVAIDGLMSERAFDAQSTVCGFGNDVLMIYTAGSSSVSGAHGGYFAAEVMELLDAAETTIKSLQAQLATGQKTTPEDAGDMALGAAIRGALELNGFTHS